MHLAAKQRQHHGLQHRDTAVPATAQAAKHKTVPGVPQLLSALDQTLVKHSFALEPLLPTPTNINPIYIPAADLKQLIAVQQWVQTHLPISLPLLNGMFVVVPSNQQQQQQQQQQLSKVLQVKCAYGNRSSNTFAAAVAGAVPWRLRQVSCVEVCPGADPADATVVLVGGERVRAGAVKQGQLAEVHDYQYLCSELADMQRRRQMCQLQVFDVAHMAWRLQVAYQLDSVIKAHKQEQDALSAAGHGPDALKQAANKQLKSAGCILRQLPPSDWVSEQILNHIELNPIVWPESPDQPWQLLTADSYTQLMRDAAEAWGHYVQCQLSGQQPQSVTEFVPWLPVSADGNATAAVSTEPPGDSMPYAACRNSSDPNCRAGSYYAPTEQQQHRARDAARPHNSYSFSQGHNHHSEQQRRRKHSSSPSSSSPSSSSPSSSSDDPGDSTGLDTVPRDQFCGRHATDHHHDGRSPFCEFRHSRSRSRSHGRSCSYSREPVVCKRNRTCTRSRSHSRGRRPYGEVSHRGGGRSLNRQRSRSLDRERSRSRRRLPSLRRKRRSRSTSHSRSRPSTPDSVTPSTSPGPLLNAAADSSSMLMAPNSRNHQAHDAQRTGSPQFQQPDTAGTFVPTDPWSQYVERQVQTWLQQLALTQVLQRWQWERIEGGSSSDPVSWDLGVLQEQHPLPEVVLCHYSNRIEVYVSARPELQWVPALADSLAECGLSASQRRFCIRSKYMAQLVAAANSAKTQAAGATGMGSSHVLQNSNSSSSDWPVYLQPQQQLLEAAAAASNAAAALTAALSNEQGPKVGTSSASPAGGHPLSIESSGFQCKAALESEIQGWLQRLALYLGPVGSSGSDHTDHASIKLITIKHKIPLPEPVRHCYNGVKGFVNERAELEWVGGQMEDSYAVYLRRRYHKQLLADAATAGLTAYQQQQQQQGNLLAAQPAQPAAAASSSYEDFVRAKRCRERLAIPSAVAYAAFIDSRVQAWLQDLAALLQPVPQPHSRPPSIKLSTLKLNLPIPSCIVQHFGSVVGFVEAVPALEWTHLFHNNFVCLVPEHHRRLLQQAQQDSR